MDSWLPSHCRAGREEAALQSFVWFCSDTATLLQVFGAAENSAAGKRGRMEISPNVVTEETLRRLLAEGYVLEVTCRDGAQKRHNSWYGSWVIKAMLPDSSSPKALVTSRSLFKPREFKTIVGLVSFLADIGCRTACIPLEQGATERHMARGGGRLKGPA
jgi:hypothetical protein